MTSQALIPSRYFTTDSSLGVRSLQFAIFVLAGVLGLALLSQVAVPLPGTPVPLTGQTFAVVLLALLFGSSLGLATLMSYFALAMAGAPVMSMGRSLALLGPTSGYVVGMVIASYLVGLLSDRGYGRSFLSAFLISFIAGLLIIAVGALGLSYFVPSHAVWAAGVLPFLAGDAIKSLAVATIMARLGRRDNKKFRRENS